MHYTPSQINFLSQRSLENNWKLSPCLVAYLYIEYCHLRDHHKDFRIFYISLTLVYWPTQMNWFTDEVPNMISSFI